MQLNVLHVIIIIIKKKRKTSWIGRSNKYPGNADTIHAIILAKISYPKNSRKKIWNPKKILRSSSPLEVQSTPTPPRSTLSQSKFLTNWAAPALFLPTRTARIHGFICLSCSWFVGNSIHCSIKLRFRLNMVWGSILTVASFILGCHLGLGPRNFPGYSSTSMPLCYVHA